MFNHTFEQTLEWFSAIPKQLRQLIRRGSHSEVPLATFSDPR